MSGECSRRLRSTDESESEICCSSFSTHTTVPAYDDQANAHVENDSRSYEIREAANRARCLIQMACLTLES
ncbi:hypothetical protein HAX54_011799, partial [Datura stramonium]|nr:hypothetical protein [Datura stramonium]